MAKHILFAICTEKLHKSLTLSKASSIYSLWRKICTDHCFFTDPLFDILHSSTRRMIQGMQMDLGLLNTLLLRSSTLWSSKLQTKNNLTQQWGEIWKNTKQLKCIFPKSKSNYTDNDKSIYRSLWAHYVNREERGEAGFVILKLEDRRGEKLHIVFVPLIYGMLGHEGAPFTANYWSKSIHGHMGRLLSPREGLCGSNIIEENLGIQHTESYKSESVGSGWLEDYSSCTFKLSHHPRKHLWNKVNMTEGRRKGH